MEAVEAVKVVADDGGSSHHKNLQLDGNHWQNVVVQPLGDVVVDGVGDCGGLLHVLHLCFGSMWAVWRLVLQPRLVRPRVYGN